MEGSTPADADIRLEGVTKRFGETLAVDALDLEIPRGAFFALLGPSGCGKTTTLRMIGGFEEPSAGRVFLGGDDVTERPPFRRDVNTVFQSYALFPHLSVERNVAFGLERRKVDRAEVRRRVAETLELVQLGGLGGRRPAQLSGGQQQRVALARALVNRPRALLLDEPLGALDLRLRKQLQIELKRIQQDVGITFVHVTHDQEEAMTMADTIAVMNAGRIEQAGGAPSSTSAPARSSWRASSGCPTSSTAVSVPRRAGWPRSRPTTGPACAFPPTASARTCRTPSASVCAPRRSRSSPPTARPPRATPSAAPRRRLPRRLDPVSGQGGGRGGAHRPGAKP